MNHSSNTNAGGWKGCDLRYDVLGSTNTNDGDATATTATNPVANTLMAALPSDLRAVMQPMTIYTDNTGGGSDNASYVTVQSCRTMTAALGARRLVSGLSPTVSSMALALR